MQSKKFYQGEKCTNDLDKEETVMNKPQDEKSSSISELSFKDFCKLLSS